MVSNELIQILLKNQIVVADCVQEEDHFGPNQNRHQFGLWIWTKIWIDLDIFVEQKSAQAKFLSKSTKIHVHAHP